MLPTTNTLRIPTIDLSLAGHGGAPKARLADELDTACREFGFFYLVGHGIDPSGIDRLMKMSRDFFAADAEEKSAIHMSKGGRAWRGYFRLGDELTSGSPDRKEGLYFGAELKETDPRVVRKLPLHGQNQFPTAPGFRTAVLDYMAQLTELSQRVLAILANGLGLSDDFFVKHYTDDPTILFRIFNYPADRSSSERGSSESWGVGAHTDYGLLTVLKQDSVGGLQVRNGQHWIDVPDIPNSFVCNVGDMLERLTRSRYLSALHRVKNSSNQDRLSMAFFFDPAFDAQLKPIQSAKRAHRPHTHVRWDEIDPNTAVGTYGEYLLSKVAKVFPELRDNVLTGSIPRESDRAN